MYFSVNGGAILVFVQVLRAIAKIVAGVEAAA